MTSPTRYQAVREALFELGPLATQADVAEYVCDQHGYQFPDKQILALYIAMVKSKMSRKPRKDSNPPSGMYSHS
jgi:hypothetical protein